MCQWLCPRILERARGCTCAALRVQMMITMTKLSLIRRTMVMVTNIVLLLLVSYCMVIIMPAAVATAATLGTQTMQIYCASGNELIQHVARCVFVFVKLGLCGSETRSTVHGTRYAIRDVYPPTENNPTN